MWPSVRVLGYDLSPDPAQPGQFARLALYYEVSAPMKVEYKSELNVTDIRGVPWGDWARAPVSEYYPTYFWQPGEYYRDVWAIPLPGDAPRGLYTAELTWLPFDAATNALERDNAKQLLIGPWRVGNFSAEVSGYSQRAKFANGITLLGYKFQSANMRPRDRNAEMAALWTLPPGQMINFSLFWKADRRVKENYTFFVHLIGPDEKIVAQSDRPAWDGMYPTDRWPVGKRVQDDYAMQIPADLPPGLYRFRVGMYLDPQRPVPLVVPKWAAGQTTIILQSELRIGEH